MTPTDRRSTTRFVAIALALAGGSAAIALAGASGSGSGEADGGLDRQRIAWAKHASTTSTAYTTALAPGGSVIRARGPITATLSGTFSGSPSEFRIRDGNRIFRPGPVSIDPIHSPLASFTFVSRGSRRSRCHTIRAEWRSPTGGESALEGVTLSLMYNHQRARSIGCQ